MSPFRLMAAVAALCLLGTTSDASAQIAGARRDLGGGFIEFLYNGGQPAGPIAGARRQGAPAYAAPTSPAHLRASHGVAPDLEPVRPLRPQTSEPQR